MKFTDAICELFGAALEELPRCDEHPCHRFATYNVERDSHWGWVRCDDHAPMDDGAILYEMGHADAVRAIESRVGFKAMASRNGEEVAEAILSAGRVDVTE